MKGPGDGHPSSAPEPGGRHFQLERTKTEKARLAKPWSVSGLPESDLSATIGRILPITAAIVPFWLVRTMVSWQETLEVFPAILVVGSTFAVTQFLWSNYMDSSLVDIMSASDFDCRHGGFPYDSGGRRKYGGLAMMTKPISVFTASGRDRR